ADYYPDIDKRHVFRLGYLARRSAHSRGSTIDLTLVRLSDKREVAMGTPYDLFSPRSAPGDRSVSAEARRNRAMLAAAMQRHGFVPYAREWWHFTLRDEPYPAREFDDPVR
ncbi:MAG: zinc D-Ala-D-Ala dipeptidase, partial [Variibacter sp.]|nr:zinc D-Ala-D-Ala dipeptidase [Variibacter sp.]